MGTTAKGLPFPDGTDFLIDGNDAIEALAEAVDDLADDYRARVINGMGTVIKQRTTNAGPVGSETALFATDSFVLDATTTIEVHFSCNGVKPSSNADCYLRLRLNSVSGTRIAQARETIGADNYGNLGTLMTVATLAAGTYNITATLESSAGTATIDASSLAPMTILAKPLY